MGQMTKTVVEPVHAACEADALLRGARDFRTLRRYFLDFVLPVLMLAAMSALTLVMLVLIVSAVAEMGLYSQSGEAASDPWSAACLGPAVLSDGRAYPDDPPRMGTLETHEPWSGPQANSELDALWACWVLE